MLIQQYSIFDILFEVLAMKRHTQLYVLLLRALIMIILTAYVSMENDSQWHPHSCPLSFSLIMTFSEHGFILN